MNERESAKNYPGVLDRRNRLIEDGKLVEENGKYVFRSDEEFSSSSAAAAVIHGGSANGLVSWKNTDGSTLKEMEDA